MRIAISRYIHQYRSGAEVYPIYRERETHPEKDVRVISNGGFDSLQVVNK